MVAERWKWFLSIWNYLDIVTIVILVTSLVQMCTTEFKDDGMTFTIVIIATSFAWLNFICLLRQTFISFATFVGGLLMIVSNLIPFSVISFLALMAFGGIFAVIILNKRDGECMNTVDDSKNTTFKFVSDFCSLSPFLHYIRVICRRSRS